MLRRLRGKIAAGADALGDFFARSPPLRGRIARKAHPRAAPAAVDPAPKPAKHFA